MITQELATKLFEYRDGILYWKISKGRAKIGNKVGSLDSKGYLFTMVNGKTYRNHRLIFLMHYGYLPEFLDHINTNKTDNRIENLRPATKSENNRNRKVQKNNTSGVKGVHWCGIRKKWQVKVSTDVGRKSFGFYDDFELAELVAQEARDKYHKEFKNNGS